MRRCIAIIVVTVCFSSVRATADGDHRVLWMRSLHSREELRVRPFGVYGIPARRAWRRIMHLFQASQGERRTISPRLLRTLVQLGRHFGGCRIDLYSGYRVPGEGHELESYHHVGHAADISIENVEPRELFDYCRQLQNST